MGLKTVPREPWRGGQICGYQTAYGLPGSVFCGEFKMLGSPVCEVHDGNLRADNYGVLPKFAEGNALGMRIKDEGFHQVLVDHDGHMKAFCASRRVLERAYGFTLSWETEDPDKPEPATEEEVAAWQSS